MKKTENVKGHGFLRKTKAFGLASGIALGATLLIGANTVSADEATTTTPSTTATTNESKTVVVDEGLTEVANKAKEAGATVNAEPTKNIGTAKTEEEATKLDEQAKKEVADQKAEIEKQVKDYQAQAQAGDKKRQETVDKLNQEGQIYNTTTEGLRAMGDDAYNKGQTSYGEFTSSKGTVRYLNAPSEFSADEIDPMISVLESAIGTAPKEITMKYSDGNLFGETVNSLKERATLKVVPILVNDGETITYKVNVAGDSELGKLGIKTVERSLTLKGSPVGAKGKVVLFADRTGSVISNYIFGGSGKTSEVMNNGKEFDVLSSWNYLDASGKAIDSKELASKFVNTKWYPTLNLKASEIKTAPTTDIKEHFLNSGNVAGVKTKTLSDKFVNGGSKFVEGTRKYKLGGFENTERIDPSLHLLSYHSKLPESVYENFSSPKTAPTVNYHLVSYTVDKAKATDNTDKLKKGSIVQVFIEEGGKEIAPKTNTGEKPVDETVTLNHPKEILFEGKTYTFTKQDKADPTKIPNGQETITYIYKLKETPKPVVVEEKKGDVEVRYIKDDASRTVLKEPVADTVGGKVGSDYDTTDNKPKTITKDGVTYEYVRSEGVEKGKVVEGKTVVTYVYREVPKPTPTPVEDPTTIHIDEDGNRIAPPEKGTKPFKNIDGYEPSPKNPKNVENPKGETVRVYEKVTPKPETPKTPETPQTPNTPEAPKPQPQQPTQAVAKATLPQTGEVASVALSIAGLGLLGLTGFATKKKRED